MKNLSISEKLQAKFQVNFNKLMDKQNVTKKEEVFKEAGRFFKYCVRNVRDGGNCPFPEYLTEAYLEKIKK